MDVKTWTTISRLLDDALDLPPGARSTWLDGLPPEYAPLKPRLRELIAQAASMDAAAFLATLPKFQSDDGDGAPGGAPLDSRAGATVGPYRLQQLLASGGQGSVWLAERTDGLLNRPVAIKLPHALAWRPGLADRMARERDILASLTHPHIARLYDAGLTGRGEPFLALEYVEGTAIDAHAAARGLGIGARARLFLQVVRAVAYAHGQLVIHRDLKPSNILVTAEGHVRLLDFGIAKLLDDAPSDSTLTAESGRAMTLAYASPEQVAQQPLGVATDVYSLGVVLFELLTGAGPYALDRESAAALEEAILTREPRRASDAVSSPALRRVLAGDLDTILAKALKKSPHDRYPSAEALADDLERYLAGRPVLAQPDSRAYRARKFVARHRVGVAASAASLVAVLAGAGVAGWQAQVARAEQRRAEDVKTFIASLLADANLDAADARQSSVLDLLKRADERLQALPSGAVKAELLAVLGEGLLSLGDTETLAVVAARAVAEADGTADEMLQVRARVLNAQTIFYNGSPDAMLAEVDVLARILEPRSARYPRELATMWRLRADALIRAARYDDAVAAARRALTIAQGASGPDSRVALDALLVVAEAENQAGHVAAFVAVASDAHVLAATIYGANRGHPEAIRARMLFADALGDAGRIAEAAEQMEGVVGDAAKLFGPEGRTVGFHLQRLANVQIRLGRLDDAVANATRAVAIIERHAAKGSAIVAAFHHSKASALVMARRGAEALPHFDLALDTARREFGPAHVNTLNVRALRAQALLFAGRIEEADREIGATLAEMRAASRMAIRPLLVGGTVARRRGRLESAGAWLADAEQAAAKDPVSLWLVLTQQGLVDLDRGRPAAALPRFERAVALVDELHIEDTPDTDEATAGLGRALIALGRAADAAPYLAKARRARAALGTARAVAAPASR